MKGFHEKNGSYFDAETLNIVNVNFHFGIPQVQKKKGSQKKKIDKNIRKYIRRKNTWPIVSCFESIGLSSQK